MVDSRRQARQIAADQIKLDVKERAGTGRRPEIYLASGNYSPLGDARRVVEQTRQIPERRTKFSFGGGRVQGNKGRLAALGRVGR